MDLAELTRDLETLQREALDAIAAARDAAALDALELDVLGKKGRLTSVLRGIGVGAVFCWAFTLITRLAMFVSPPRSVTRSFTVRLPVVE